MQVILLIANKLVINNSDPYKSLLANKWLILLTVSLVHLSIQTSLYIMDTVSLLYRGVLYVEVILYSKECNWYTRCCPLNGGVRYRECPLRETILYMSMYMNDFKEYCTLLNVYMYVHVLVCDSLSSFFC